MVKIDINKYKEEDITNISKEETPIVKALDKRQTAGFISGFVLFVLCGANAYFYNEIGRVPATIIEIVLAAALIFCIIYSINMFADRISPKNLEQNISLLSIIANNLEIIEVRKIKFIFH